MTVANAMGGGGVDAACFICCWGGFGVIDGLWKIGEGRVPGVGEGIDPRCGRYEWDWDWDLDWETVRALELVRGSPWDRELLVERCVPLGTPLGTPVPAPVPVPVPTTVALLLGEEECADPFEVSEPIVPRPAPNGVTLAGLAGR